MNGWGAPPWRIEAHIPPAPLPRSADVVIVGAGLTGLATAWALARAGVRRVVVVDEGRVGDGASGRTGGIALEGTAIGDLDGVEACLDELHDLVEAAGIDCDLELGGCRELVHGDRPDAATLPWRDGGMALSVHDTVAGGTVDPGKLLSGLCMAVQGCGVTVHEGSAVSRIESGDGGVRLHCGRGTTDAGFAVFAMNAYTPSLLRLPPPFCPALTLALCTAPLDASTLAMLGLTDRLPFYTVDLPYLWGRVLPDGGIVFGAGLVFAGDDGDVRRVDIGQPDAAGAMTRLESRVRGLHPVLIDVSVCARWGGPVAVRRGGAPVLSRHPESRHVIVTGGYSGHGVALGVKMGALVAAAIVERRPLPRWGDIAGAATASP